MVSNTALETMGNHVFYWEFHGISTFCWDHAIGVFIIL